MLSLELGVPHTCQSDLHLQTQLCCLQFYYCAMCLLCFISYHLMFTYIVQYNVPEILKIIDHMKWHQCRDAPDMKELSFPFLNSQEISKNQFCSQAKFSLKPQKQKIMHHVYLSALISKCSKFLFSINLIQVLPSGKTFYQSWYNDFKGSETIGLKL